MKTEVWGSKKTQLLAILSFRTVEGNTADEIHDERENHFSSTMTGTYSKVSN